MSKKELNMIVPLRLDPEEGAEMVISRSKILFEKYGMKKFIYFCPSKGWRGKCYPPKEEFERCIELISNKQIDVLKFLDKVVSLEETQEAYDELMDGKTDTIKILEDLKK